MKDRFKVSARDIPKLTDGWHRIEQNFYLRVRNEGKVRQYIFRADGREKAIGPCAKLSFSEAKAKMLDMRSRLVAGEDVFAPNPKKERAKKARPITFAEFAPKAIDAIEKAKRWRNAKQAAQWRSTVEQYAVPIIGEKPIENLTRTDILAVLTPIWETKTETAKRLRGRLHKIIDYATFLGLYDKPNPARWDGNLEMVLAPPSKVRAVKHHEALTADEARRIAKNLREGEWLSYAAVLFGMLTACRAEEFVNARWSEIDLNKGTFTIPVERIKIKRKEPFVVPLSTHAVDLLMGLNRMSDFVFTKTGERPYCIDTPRKTLRIQARRPVTMHGCRSTFRDWCAENGKDRILAEKCLMHTTGTEVEEAYQRSDLLEQRRVLMQEWADFLLS